MSDLPGSLCCPRCNEDITERLLPNASDFWNRVGEPLTCPLCGQYVEIDYDDSDDGIMGIWLRRRRPTPEETDKLVDEVFSLRKKVAKQEARIDAFTAGEDYDPQ